MTSHVALIEPDTVMVIDQFNTGKLVSSNQPYDAHGAYKMSLALTGEI